MSPLGWNRLYNSWIQIFKWFVFHYCQIYIAKTLNTHWMYLEYTLLDVIASCRHLVLFHRSLSTFMPAICVRKDIHKKKNYGLLLCNPSFAKNNFFLPEGSYKEKDKHSQMLKDHHIFFCSSILFQKNNNLLAVIWASTF